MSVQEALALHCVILGYPASACVCLCVCTPGIRQLQLMLLKVSLILGVEIHVNVEFTRLVEPPAEQTDGSECVCVPLSVCYEWQWHTCISQLYMESFQLAKYVC